MAAPDEVMESDEDFVRFRIKLVLDQARKAGLLGSHKDARISGRVSATLLGAAKQQTHLTSDTELIELALSRLVLEDDFGRKFLRRKGTVPRKLDLEI